MANNDSGLSRRQFIAKSAKTAALCYAFTLPGRAYAAGAARKKICLVGTGSRGTSTWGKNLFKPYSEQVELVGLCDINPKRIKVAQNIIGINAPGYGADDFEKMIKETKPDAVIITTPDCFHAHYAVKALKLGCDVYCEKPLATDASQCKKLLAAEKSSGKKLIVTFNCRHMATTIEIKKFILSGKLGKIISAEYHEALNVNHGASYFRRWHGKMKYSGSLLVHKASHHFDEMNWWLDAEPKSVNAMGKVAYYGKNGPFRAQNCRQCPHAKDCKFFWDITKNKKYMELYVDCEAADGYLRDGCIFNEKIDTFDTMAVQIEYDNGTILDYSLDAAMPYEGQQILIKGEKGTLEARRYIRQPWEIDCDADLRFTENFGQTSQWKVQRVTGAHGGADMKLKDMLFIPGTADPLNKLADSRAGVFSSLAGIAARESIQKKKTIDIKKLVKLPPKA
jgi:predicted dehydrogenase